LCRNLGGRAFAAAEQVTTLPRALGPDDVDVVDLLGDGTAALVWSTTGFGRGPTRFLRLMAEGKPHLLTSVSYGTGLEVRLTYAPSTRFYVDAREAGRPWATRLPFPVQCVQTVETLDHVRAHRLTQRYAYHH